MSTTTVSNAEELLAALKSATGGDTILLEGGDYGVLNLSQYSKFSVDFASEVTIASADPEDPAVFTGLKLSSVSNLTIDGVVFDYVYEAGDQYYTNDFTISGSTNVTISNSVFDGDNASGTGTGADGYGLGLGLYVNGSTGITLDGNLFTTFYRAVTVSNSSDITVTGNEITDMRSDGLTFAGVQDLLIEDNYIHDFRGNDTLGDHRDMIQFWTSGTTTASSNITIRGNTLDIGDGSYTQSILMGNELVSSGSAGTEMYYQNVVIEDNVIYNDHLHGISVGQVNGLTISGNTLVQVVDDENAAQDSSSLWVPQINVSAASTNVTIADNITGGVSGYTDQSTWTVDDNLIIQNTNATAANYYGDIFLTSSMTANEDGSHSYVLLSDYAGIGAVVSSKGGTSDLAPEFQVSEDADSASTWIFDASYSLRDGGSLPEDATYSWDFGDGTSATGLVVAHSYATGGKYTAILTVTLADGTTSSQSAAVASIGASIIEMDDSGRLIAANSGTETLLASLGTSGLDLGATGTVLKVAASNLSNLRSADNFELDLSISADTVGSIGEIFRIHNTLGVSVNAKGELQVTLTTTDQAVAVKTTGIVVNDGAEHDISISFEDGQLLVTIDGKEAASIAVSGEIASSLRDLTFGNPWGQTNFDGHVTNFDLTTDSDDYTGTASTTVVDSTGSAGEHAAVTVPEAESGSDSGSDSGSESVSPVDVPNTSEESGTTSSETATGETVQTPDAASDTDTAVIVGGLQGNVLTLNDLLAGAKVGGDTVVVQDDAGNITSVSLDGTDDYVHLGRLTDIESSDRVAFELEFTRSGEETAGNERLVWNHTRIGLQLTDDGLIVSAMGADGVYKSYGIKDLGLDDTETHSVSVLLDDVADHLQVVLDGEIVFELTDVDFELSEGAGHGYQWGWTLGSQWNEDFSGEMSSFSISSDFEFYHTTSDTGL